MEKLAHEIVRAYKNVYYAHWRAEANREAKKVTAAKSRAVEVEAQEKLATELASQQAAWTVERATLLQDKEKTEKGLHATQTQAMEATLLLKEAVEVNTWTQEDLHICSDQVYKSMLFLYKMQPPP